jgi:hypothetical protein
MILSDVSNPEMVLKKVRLYGNDVIIKESTRKDKKYMIYNTNTNKYVHFGSLSHLDYTKYLELYGLEVANKNRKRYLNRALNIKGNWKENAYSPNNLSIYLIWIYDI